MAQLFFVGDSITMGAWDERGGWANRLIGEIMQLKIAALTDGSEFYCLPCNLGVSGDTVPDVQARLLREVEARSESGALAQTEIVIYIGANDAMYLNDEQRPRFSEQEFTDNFTKLLELANSLAARISCLGLLPVDEAHTVPLPWAPEFSCKRDCLQAYERIIERLCQARGVRFLPLFARWLTLPRWEELLLDGEHPNSAGHAKLAEIAMPFVISDEFLAYHST